MSESNLPVATPPTGLPGVVVGQPRFWLGLEAAIALLLITAIYHINGYSWLLYAVVFFMPDISIFAYLLNTRTGAVCYNALHNYVLPMVLLVICHLAGLSLAIPLIWSAHVAFDRAFGYGLKYDQGFTFTHLSWRYKL